MEFLGKITRQELSPGIRSELDKSGNLASLTTTEKGSLVGAVNEVDGNVDGHVGNTTDAHGINTKADASVVSTHLAESATETTLGHVKAKTDENGLIDVGLAEEEIVDGKRTKTAVVFEKQLQDEYLTPVGANATTYNSVTITEGTTVSRVNDNSTTTANNERGLIVKPNKNILGIKAQVSNNTSGVTLARLRDAETGQILDEVDISSQQEFILIGSMEKDKNYGILLFADSADYTFGHNNSASAPYLSDDIDILGGTFSFPGIRTDRVYNVDNVTAITSVLLGLNDGDTETFWQPDPTNEENAWVYVDLGENKRLNAIQIYWNEDADYRPLDYEIATALDSEDLTLNGDWQLRLNPTEQPNAGWNEYLLADGMEIMARYIRVKINTHGIEGTRINEIMYSDEPNIWKHGHINMGGGE